VASEWLDRAEARSSRPAAGEIFVDKWWNAVQNRDFGRISVNKQNVIRPDEEL